MKKIFASIAAVAAASALTLSVSATDWEKASYADGDPSTVKIVATDENSVTATSTSDGGWIKIRITLDKILENPEDISNIKSGSWKVTYKGLSSYDGTDIGWLGGGTYAATGNSVTYGISPAEWTEEGTVVWDDTITLDDSFKWLLPSSVPTDITTAEFVFMDWSNQILEDKVTMTISDFKLFDAAGNEIAQKPYGFVEAAEEAAEEATEEAAPEETEAAVEEVAEEAAEEVVEEAAEPVVEEVVEEAAPVVEVVEEAPAPAPVATTTPVATGNTAVAAIAGIMALAGAAAVVSKRK